MFDPALLTTFVTVAKARSFTEAGRRLGLRQSTISQHVRRLEQAALKAGGILAITSDHGNAEEKIDPDGNPLTAHTTNPVPLVLVSDKSLGTFANGGKLGDVAPTLLPLLGLDVPAEMTGTNLLRPITLPAQDDANASG